MAAVADVLPKGAIKSSASSGVFGVVTDVKPIGRQRGNPVDNVSEKVKELRSFTEASHRYWESLGYTEDSFIDMVEEEIHACRKEAAERDALALK